MFPFILIFFYLISIYDNRSIKDSIKYKDVLIFPPLNMNQNRHYGMTLSTASKTDNVWLGGIIPIEVDEELKNDDNFIQLLINAMYEIQNKTLIRFVWKTFELNYVDIISDNDCYSQVGMQQGKQLISLPTTCHESSIILHELMHTVGMMHHHNRPDRDKYVSINYDNIEHASISSYDIQSENIEIWKDIPYDYRSIMHYKAYAHSRNGLATILIDSRSNTTIDIDEIGGKHLSETDIMVVESMYKMIKSNETWSDWTAWSKCDNVCEGGRKFRRKLCRNIKDFKYTCQPTSIISYEDCPIHTCLPWPIWPKDFYTQCSDIGTTTSNLEFSCVLIQYNTKECSFCVRKMKRNVLPYWSMTEKRNESTCLNITDQSLQTLGSLCFVKQFPYKIKQVFTDESSISNCLLFKIDNSDKNSFLCEEKSITNPVLINHILLAESKDRFAIKSNNIYNLMPTLKHDLIKCGSHFQTYAGSIRINYDKSFVLPCSWAILNSIYNFITLTLSRQTNDEKKCYNMEISYNQHKESICLHYNKQINLERIKTNGIIISINEPFKSFNMKWKFFT